MKKIAAVVLCAGSSVRFGEDKLQALIDGKEVWKHSADLFLGNPEIQAVYLVSQDGKRYETCIPIPGGNTRQESVRNAIEVLHEAYDFVLIHDGARPFATPHLVRSVLDHLAPGHGVVPGIPVTDTIRDAHITLDRSSLKAVQTPQACDPKLLKRAYDLGLEATDEAGLLDQMGIPVMVIEGELSNRKITHPNDLPAQKMDIRTGIGYDIHCFSQDPDRELWLGGVLFDHKPGLEGHSDADVVLHAIVDALLGAAALGDIGQLYPNTDPTWKNFPSIQFLKETRVRLAELNWQVVNVDATVIAEMPKVMPRSDEIRAVIAHALQISVDRVAFKATTNERLGAVGRGEGIAAMAVATLRRPER